jgi:hypothetical protein
VRCGFGNFAAECDFEMENFLSPQIAIPKAAIIHSCVNAVLGNLTQIQSWTNFSWMDGRALGWVFYLWSGCMHTMHLQPSVAIRPNLELKTQPKQLLGSLPLVIVLPDTTNSICVTLPKVANSSCDCHCHWHGLFKQIPWSLIIIIGITATYNKHYSY